MELPLAYCVGLVVGLFIGLTISWLIIFPRYKNKIIEKKYNEPCVHGFNNWLICPVCGNEKFYKIFKIGSKMSDKKKKEEDDKSVIKLAKKALPNIHFTITDENGNKIFENIINRELQKEK